MLELYFEVPKHYNTVFQTDTRVFDVGLIIEIVHGDKSRPILVWLSKANDGFWGAISMIIFIESCYCTSFCDDAWDFEIG